MCFGLETTKTSSAKSAKSFPGRHDKKKQGHPWQARKETTAGLAHVLGFQEEFDALLAAVKVWSGHDSPAVGQWEGEQNAVWWERERERLRKRRGELLLTGPSFFPQDAQASFQVFVKTLAGKTVTLQELRQKKPPNPKCSARFRRPRGAAKTFPKRLDRKAVPADIPPKLGLRCPHRGSRPKT